jgi:uncharacterized protein (DUF4415 family)
MNNNGLKTTSQTDWEALESMTEEDIDFSDIPPLTEEFFQNASLRIPASQISQWVKLEPDILEWFQSQTSEHKTLINEALRQYIAHHPSK